MIIYVNAKTIYTFTNSKLRGENKGKSIADIEHFSRRK